MLSAAARGCLDLHFRPRGVAHPTIDFPPSYLHVAAGMAAPPATAPAQISAMHGGDPALSLRGVFVARASTRHRGEPGGNG